MLFTGYTFVFDELKYVAIMIAVVTLTCRLCCKTIAGDEGEETHDVTHSLFLSWEYSVPGSYSLGRALIQSVKVRNLHLYLKTFQYNSNKL